MHTNTYLGQRLIYNAREGKKQGQVSEKYEHEKRTHKRP